MEFSCLFSSQCLIAAIIYGVLCLVVGAVAGFVLRAALAGGRAKSSGGVMGGAVEIYVGNLSYEVDDRELKKAFEKYGEVKSTRVIRNKFNNKSKGFGFVEMPDREEAVEAIRALNGTEWKGRRIVVNEAKNEPRDG